MKKLLVEKNSLLHNLEQLNNMTQARIIAVLKGNGYGLGLVEYARVLVEKGIDFFAVAELQEALSLRSNGIEGSILLLAPPADGAEAETLISSQIVPTIGSSRAALLMDETAERLGTQAAVHLKIDTGFGRFGFQWDKADEAGLLFHSLANLRVEGTYSHLSYSFAKKRQPIDLQFHHFLQAVEMLRQQEVEPGLLHLANSCAFLRFPEMHLDAVRLGSALLGRIPISNTWGLKRVGRLSSRIIEVKELPTGHSIGYADTYQTRRPTRIGIVPIGYKDGFGLEKSRDTFRPIDILRYLYHDLQLFKKAIQVEVLGKKAPILGRVSMYNIIVDITHLDAQVGDPVLLDVNPILVDSAIEREYVVS